jgi:1-acyl-sn-glycerol-3-phosphate acyltransferase
MRLPLRVPGDPWLYVFARVLLVGAVTVYGRFRAEGAGELPASGPAIVVANHPSDVDPILLAVSFPRTLHFMADVVQFRRGFVGPVIRRLAAFPIDKGSPDRRSLETALDLLRRGEVVAVFPEGDLYRQAEPEPFGPGIGFLAARSGAPVIPVRITGAERIWAGRRLHRPRVTLRAGTALRFDGAPAAGDHDAGRKGRHAYLRFAEQTRAAVLALRDGGPG